MILVQRFVIVTLKVVYVIVLKKSTVSFSIEVIGFSV